MVTVAAASVSGGGMGSGADDNRRSSTNTQIGIDPTVRDSLVTHDSEQNREQDQRIVSAVIFHMIDMNTYV